MLERLVGNDALKSELGTALRGGRLPHAILLVGEPGCGAGFAARCLAADYLYPQGGAHAEAVLKKEDAECLVLGLSGFLAFYGREVFFWCRDAIASWKRRRDWENRNR